VFAQPHSDPRRQELQWQRQQRLRRDRRRPSHSPLLRVEIPSVKPTFAVPQIPSIAYLWLVPVLGQDAIESLNFQLRKIIKTRGHFPSDDAAFKLLYLALSRAQEKWTMPIRNWKNALNQFAVHFEGRLPV
jgi:putative transposase